MTERKQTASGYGAGEWGTKPLACADCLTCGWTCQAKNAHGLGAQHARRHKHCVCISVEKTHVYNHEEK